MAKAPARSTTLTTNADLYSVKRYAQARCRTLDPNWRKAPLERVRSPREAQKGRMEGWSDTRITLPRLTLLGLRKVAIILAEEGQHSPWPHERRRYPKTKSHLVGEALDDFFRELGFPEFCVAPPPGEKPR
jgi:hypothetical protein